MRTELIKCRGNRTIQETADAMNISRQMLGAIERGERTPSLKVAKRIADFYGKPVEQLFFNQIRHKSCQ